jgi:mxaJ protein
MRRLPISRCPVRRFRVLSAGAVALAALAAATATDLQAQQQPTSSPSVVVGRPPHVFRVCADPDDLPFSNDKQQGFDNKIAAVLAKDLNDTLTFAWWPTRRGFVRNTLSSSGCDVIIGVPKGYDLVLPTNPYYRAAYVAVTRRDRQLKIATLDDSVFKSLKIGVSQIGDNYTNTPPAQALGARGIIQNVMGFTSFYTPDHPPGEIIDAVATGRIDVALAWGPLAGYYAKQSSVPLELSALPDTDRATGLPFAYELTLGVRRADRGLRDTLNMALDRRRTDIEAILRDYGVPMLPLSTAATTH